MPRRFNGEEILEIDKILIHDEGGKSGKDKETVKDKEDRKGGGMAKAEVSVRACTSAHSKIL